MVADTAPRVFAVVEEYETEEPGEMDAWVAGWGLAYEDGTAHVNATDANLHLSLRSPDRAATVLGLGHGADTYLIWPDAS